MKKKHRKCSNTAKRAVAQLSCEEITAIASEAARAEIARQVRTSLSPSPETLALIAANVAKGGSLKPVEAIAYAAELYDEARAKLERAMKYQDAAAHEADAWADFPQPEKYPAPFGDFLRLIVNAKTPADSTKRFREFLRHRWKRFCAGGNIEEYPKWAEWTEQKLLAEMKPEERQNPKWAGVTEQQIAETLLQENLEKKVLEDLEEHQRGVPDQYQWCLCAKDYRAWWASQRSAQAKAAAKKSKKAH